MFNPNGGVFTGSAQVTITSETDGATIYYTTDGTDPVVSRSSIANGGTVTLTESCTLKAMAVKSGMNNSAIVTSQSYTINSGSSSGSKIYRKVTSTNDLVAGQKYIIVYENGSSSVGMGAYDGSKHFNGVQNLTVSNSKVNIANNSVLEMTLGGSTGAWTLYTGSGYIQGADAVQFNVVNNSSADNSKWIITNTVSGTNGFVVENAEYDRYIKCYNSSSFRHYASGSGTWAYLYVQESDNTPHLTALPETLNINDSGTNNTFTVEGSNLGGDNVGLTQSGSNFTPTLTATTGNPYYGVYDGAPYWGFTPNNGSVNGTVEMNYSGRELSASETVTLGNSSGASATVTVNYRADVYILGNYGSGWDYSNGILMTYDATNNTYTADVTVNTGNLIVFARKLGESNPWNTRILFGPNSDGDWWVDSNPKEGTIDLNDDDPIYFVNAGTYTVEINASTGALTISKYTVNVTISPADGTHFTGPTISGTITSEPAGTIEWSTDGTNWQTYTDGFTATVNNVGGTVTVYARSTSNGVTSDVAQATYTRDLAPAPEPPTFSIGSSAVASGTVVTITAPEGCTLYVDGQQVTNPYDVTITSSTTITAYCVNDEGTQSTTVTNTYNIAAVCNAIVQFKDNGSDATNATSWNAIGGEGDNNYFEAGRNYISNATDIARVFKGTTGFKFGNSSIGGTITFNLNTENTEWKVSHITINARCFDPTFLVDYQPTFTVTTSNGQSQTTQQVTSSTVGGYTLDFDGTAITSITISTNYRAYLKGFTITYDCAPTVEAPVITPTTGTYYENQSVHISADDGCTIYYTTNGSDPTTNSPVFTDDFNVSYNAGSTTTVKAIAVDGEGAISDVATVVYTWGVPSVHIHPDSRNTTASSMTVTLTPNPTEAQVYYTTDGSTPSATNGTLYTGSFTVDIPNVGDQATVKAIAVLGNATSPVATATYTHVENVLDVHTPFFSPLVNHTYYGDQTLQIATTTPNADIYYEIVEVSGTTAPSASSVEDPTHVSTHYDGTPIEMTVGNSYYVKAIAYVGNNPSSIAEGWYTIVAAPTTQYTYTNLKDFNDNCPTGVTAHFVNPVQVVYHSTYTNNGEYAEFCYLRDNTDYACVYFGKRDTNNNTIFKMGDWIDGSQISGLTNIWDRNFHIQLGTNAHTVYTWPSQAIGWSEILPEDMTCDIIVAGDTVSNVWGHYVHLRNTRLSSVTDYSASDPKHTGLINDGTADVYYYDKFYRWSAGTCSYTTGGNTYTDPIQCLGDYDQAFFTAKQNAGATFDVYGVVDYYSQYTPPFEMCPIDFLWAYKPQMTPATTTSFEPVTVNITATQPEWAAEGVVIYYKTDDMEEWAVYTGPITVNSTTTIQAYAEVAAEKTNGTNYNDFVRSEILTETYTIEGIEDPTISPASQVIEIVTGEESVTVTVTDHNQAGSGAVTTYTVNGVEYTLEAGQSVEIVVTETTTITAVSSIVSGEHTLYSNEVSETYEFIESNGKTYNLLTTNPVVGNVYVIVNKADKVGLSTTQNANNRAAIGVTFTNNNKTVVNGNTSLAEFILESANAGRYYFREVGTQNYLCVTTNEYANLMTGAADVNAEAAATVNSSVTSGVDQSYPATITFYYDGTPRYLRYYTNNRTFTTYGDATANQDVFLYGIAAPTVYDPAIDPHTQVVQVTTGDEYLNVTVIPNAQNPEGAVTYYTTDGSDPRDPNSDRHIWDENSQAEFVNTNTTVKAATCVEFADTYVWSNVVSETYTFVGIQPPVIDPETGTYWDGETVTVTITPDSTNPEGTVTYYTTDGSDPRTENNPARIEWDGTPFDVTDNTTVKAASCLDVDGTTVWSVMTEETYTFQAVTETTLAEIESTGTVNNRYVVADELIGVWAVVNPAIGVNQLWAKDQGNVSIDQTSIVEGQTDYVKDIWGLQKRAWDQSNWVVLDFNGTGESAYDYESRLLKEKTVVGDYVNDLNYTIKLAHAPETVNNNSVTGYPGYDGDHAENTGTYYYNHYTPANFMKDNLNAPYGEGAEAGPASPVAGKKLFFMNPKVQEVAQVWAVWMGNDRFDVLETNTSASVNGYDLSGAFDVLTWDYNRLNSNSYGCPITPENPDALEVGKPYLFHVIITRNDMTYGHQRRAPGATPDSSFGIKPADLPSGHPVPTIVRDLTGKKVVESVSYFNLMGQESSQPFEGINIVVTRYSDGSTSTVKVLR